MATGRTATAGGGRQRPAGLAAGPRAGGRPVARGAIAFGLVSIPVRFHAATRPQPVRFHLLHARCGTRIQHRTWCPRCQRLVERADLVRGYPVGGGRLARFTEAELERAERSGERLIEIGTFVPLATVDPIYYEHAYYLGPEARGAKPYRLLTEAMRQSGQVAVGSVQLRGREHLVLLRPIARGLVLHQLYYGDEVLDPRGLLGGDPALPASAELALAKRLIAQIATEAFDPRAYRDAFRERIQAAARRKAAGEEVAARPAAGAPRARTLDLREALRRSLAGSGRPRAGGRPGRARAVSLARARARGQVPRAQAS